MHGKKFVSILAIIIITLYANDKGLIQAVCFALLVESIQYRNKRKQNRNKNFLYHWFKDVCEIEHVLLHQVLEKLTIKKGKENNNSVYFGITLIEIAVI